MHQETGESPERLESFRRLAVEIVTAFIEYGQCGRLKDGEEVLDTARTIKAWRKFEQLRADIEKAENFRALATAVGLARWYAVEERFWVTQKLRDYSEALLAFSWLERHGLLSMTPLENALPFAKY